MRFMLKNKTKSELQIKKLGSNESVAMSSKPMKKSSDLGKTARGSIALTVRVRQTDRQTDSELRVGCGKCEISVSEAVQ